MLLEKRDLTKIQCGIRKTVMGLHTGIDGYGDAGFTKIQCGIRKTLTGYGN